MMRFKIEGRVAKTIISLALLGVMMFSVTAQAAGVTLSSKGTLTVDGTNVDIHSSDIYSLKSAYEANSTSLTNMNSAVNDYRTKAATTYANIDTISSGIDTARTNMAKGLKNMGVQYDDTTDKFYAKNTPTDWYATTTQTIGASSHGKSLAQLISLLGSSTISMNGSTSQATATPGAANVASGASKIAKTDTAGIALANKSTLVLDSGAQVTLPAGYYGSPITVQNGGASEHIITDINRNEVVEFSSTIGQQYLCVCQSNAGFIPSLTSITGADKTFDAGSKMISSDKSYSGVHFYLITATDSTVKLAKNVGTVHVLTLTYK